MSALPCGGPCTRGSARQSVRSVCVLGQRIRERGRVHPHLPARGLARRLVDYTNKYAALPLSHSSVLSCLTGISA